jgi:hypothetical protein
MCLVGAEVESKCTTVKHRLSVQIHGGNKWVYPRTAHGAGKMTQTGTERKDAFSAPPQSPGRASNAGQATTVLAGPMKKTVPLDSTLQVKNSVMPCLRFHSLALSGMAVCASACAPTIEELQHMAAQPGIEASKESFPASSMHTRSMMTLLRLLQPLLPEDTKVRFRSLRRQRSLDRSVDTQFWSEQ